MHFVSIGCRPYLIIMMLDGNLGSTHFYRVVRLVDVNLLLTLK